MNTLNKMKKIWKPDSEFTVVAKAFLIILLVGLLLTTIIFVVLNNKSPVPDDEVCRIAYLEQYVAVIQIIAVGVVVALISVVIPMMLPETRDRFERYKESRKAYSEAKTAVMYLADHIIGANRKTAFEMVEDAHQKLHYAETFEPLLIAKGYLYWFKVPKLWVLYNYWQIVAVAEVLRNTDWDSMKDTKKRERLLDAVKVVRETFGERGEKVKLEKWCIKDPKRWKDDDDLEIRYDREDELKRKIERCLKNWR